MQSVMTDKYRTADVEISRSSFNRSFGVKTTFDMDYLVPFMVDPVLPGETHSMDLTALNRMVSPLLTPIMDNIYIDFHFFKVPYRS